MENIENNKTRNELYNFINGVGRAAATSAASIGAGAGIAGFGGKAFLDNKISPSKSLLDDLSKIKSAPNLDPHSFSKTYADAGHRLMNDSITIEGTKIPGLTAIKGLRSGTIGGILKDLGLHHTPLDEEGIRHYDEFKKSPVNARSMVLKEMFGSDNEVGNNILNEYKGKRWDALQGDGDLIDNLTKSISGDSKDYSYSRAAVKSVEDKLKRADPVAYRKYMSEINSAIKSNDVNKLTELDNIKEYLFKKSRLGGRTARSLAEEMSAGSRSPLSRLANISMKKGFSGHAKNYGRIYDKVKGVTDLSKLMNRIGIGGSLLSLGGLGMAGYLSTRNNKNAPQDKPAIKESSLQEQIDSDIQKRVNAKLAEALDSPY